jgi:heme oxygenase
VESHQSQSGVKVMKCPFTHMAAAPAASLADALKERTKEAHARAEKHSVQSRMVKGEVSREEYGEWLRQMLPVWRAIDRGLAGLSERDARVAAIVKPYHVHAGRIEADLKFLSQDEGMALPATKKFVEMVNRAAESVNLLGVWYVLEGSSNGGRYIAKALSRGLGIAGPEGLMNFDPHGELQRERWQAWRAGLDTQTFSMAEREGIVAAASATFDAVTEVMEDMTSSAARAQN